MPKAQSKGCQRKNRIQQGPGVNEQQIDSEDKGDLQYTLPDEKCDSLVSSEPATAAASGSPASHLDHALTTSSPRSSCS